MSDEPELLGVLHDRAWRRACAAEAELAALKAAVAKLASKFEERANRPGESLWSSDRALRYSAVELRELLKRGGE